MLDGGGSESAEERRLLLPCYTHRRKVDAPFRLYAPERRGISFVHAENEKPPAVNKAHNLFNAHLAPGGIAGAVCVEQAAIKLRKADGLLGRS